MLAIVDEPVTNERMVLEERCRAIAHEEIDWRVGKCASEIFEQRRGQHDVAEASQLDEENLTRMQDAGRLHSGSRHSFAYCTNA